MKTFRKSLLVAALGSAFVTTGAQAEDSASITEALKASSTKLHLRARYESVEQAGTEDAAATTLKTRLTFTSGTYEGFGLTLEMDDTTELGKDDYTDGNTPKGTAPIADPEGTEVNQAYISYKKDSVTAKYGRQRILLDNQRFVGGVGWRQDEQTYDAFSVSYKPTEELSVFAAYVTDVKRIFAEAQDHNHDTFLLNASYNFGMVKAIGYGYLIDNSTAVALSSDTFGLRLQFKFNDMFSANLEGATQSEGGDFETEYTASYSLLEGIAAIPVGESKLTVKLGFEVLGSDDTVTPDGTPSKIAFKTPLATLHAFQGWTDKFLNTPDDGVEDMYISLGSKIGPVKAAVVYHDLSASEGDTDYGSELGLVLGGKVGPVGITFKYADYSADDHASDTTKLWLMAAATF